MAPPQEAGGAAPDGADEAVLAKADLTLSPDEGLPGLLPGVGAEEASWPAESAESAFLAEARGRGEPPVAVPVNVAMVDEPDRRPLPPLDELVGRIPPEVREALEDLFRAKFVRVTRVPGKTLK